MIGADLKHGDAFTEDRVSTRQSKYVFWEHGKPEDTGPLDYIVIRGDTAIYNLWKRVKIRLVQRWDGYIRQLTQPVIKKKDWPHVCPTCGSPALMMFTTIDCSERCKTRPHAKT